MVGSASVAGQAAVAPGPTNVTDTVFAKHSYNHQLARKSNPYEAQQTIIT